MFSDFRRYRAVRKQRCLRYCRISFQLVSAAGGVADVTANIHRQGCRCYCCPMLAGIGTLPACAPTLAGLHALPELDDLVFWTPHPNASFELKYSSTSFQLVSASGGVADVTANIHRQGCRCYCCPTLAGIGTLPACPPTLAGLHALPELDDLVSSVPRPYGSGRPALPQGYVWPLTLAGIGNPASVWPLPAWQYKNKKDSRLGCPSGRWAQTRYIIVLGSLAFCHLPPTFISMAFGINTLLCLP